MSYLHKYGIKGYEVYVVSEDMNRPAASITLRQDDWQGRALGKVNSVVRQINDLSFTKEAKPTEETEKAKKASIVEELDKIATDLESQGQAKIALAIDKISDSLTETID